MRIYSSIGTTFEKYKQNLKVENNKVYSYGTIVAEISGDTIKKIDWEINRDWKDVNEDISASPTTSKHINYVANELGLTIC